MVIETIPSYKVGKYISDKSCFSFCCCCTFFSIAAAAAACAYIAKEEGEAWLTACYDQWLKTI